MYAASGSRIPTHGGIILRSRLVRVQQAIQMLGNHRCFFDDSSLAFSLLVCFRDGSPDGIQEGAAMEDVIEGDVQEVCD